MNENETEEMEVIDVESVGSLDDLVDEVLKERGSVCSTCNND